MTRRTLKLVHSVLVMGVSGSGKSTVANLLASQLGCPLLEGDSLHSDHNIERMAAGNALTDADRQDWLAAIAARIAAAARAGQFLVVSCSALKRSYRDILRRADPRLVFGYLNGDMALIRARLAQRRHHFMPPALLESQFQALEEPALDEHALECSIALNPHAMVASILPRIIEAASRP